MQTLSIEISEGLYSDLLLSAEHCGLSVEQLISSILGNYLLNEGF